MRFRTVIRPRITRNFPMTILRNSRYDNTRYDSNLVNHRLSLSTRKSICQQIIATIRRIFEIRPSPASSIYVSFRRFSRTSRFRRNKRVCIYKEREREERGEHSVRRPFCRSLLGSLTTSQFPPKRNDLHALLFVSAVSLRKSTRIVEGERERERSFRKFSHHDSTFPIEGRKVEIFLSRTRSRAIKKSNSFNSR